MLLGERGKFGGTVDVTGGGSLPLEVFLERIDVATGARPVEDGKKYPVQEGFLWTNGVYTWILKNILNQEFKPASK